jgi:hypothetical protein
MIQPVSSRKLRIDSLKVKFPSDFVRSVRDESFIQHLTLVGNNGELRKGRKSLDRKSHASGDVVGLKNIELREDFSILEISAKVLRERYHELISLENIEEVVSRVNGTGIITLAPSFLDHAQVLKCDCTSDLHVSRDVGEYLQSLKTIAFLNPKYHAKPYKRTGLVLRREVSSYGERLLLYDKFTEVMRDKDRKALKADNFRDVLRVESNHVELRSIRKRLGLPEGDIRLMDALSSKENPNLKIFSNVFDSPDIAEAKARYDRLRANGEPMHKLEKRYGRENIIADCNHDMRLVREFLKGKYSEGSNISHIVREYSELLADMLARGEAGEESRALTFDTECIGELRELLKVA